MLVDLEARNKCRTTLRKGWRNLGSLSMMDYPHTLVDYKFVERKEIPRWKYIGGMQYWYFHGNTRRIIVIYN